MEKKNQSWVILGIMIVVIILLIKFSPSKQTVVQVSDTIPEHKFTNMGSNYGVNYKGLDETSSLPAGSEDICNSVKSYSTLMNALCNLNGGVWTCNSVEVSCTGLKTYTIDCTASNVQSALNECQAAGAQTSCSNTTVSCKY